MGALMMKSRTSRLLLLLIAILALGGGLRAMTAQKLTEFKVTQEVEADYSVPFPVDI